MLNGKLTKFISGWNQFKWINGANIEFARLQNEKVTGLNLVAKLMVHDWMPDIRSRPAVIQAILIDAFQDALKSLDVDSKRHISAVMAQQLGE